MSKHWIIRIQKPSLNATFAIIVGGTTAVCIWWFLKRLALKSSKRGPTPDAIKHKALANESLYATQMHMDDAFSTRSPTTALSNHQSFSRVLSHRTSISTISTLAVDCGAIGLQTLNRVVDQVEECISKINRTVQQLSTKDPSADVFIKELQKFLETSILLREQFKRAFIQETSVSASDLQCVDSLSDVDNESFFSSVEEIDYSELELQIISNYHRPLYRNALKEINESSPVCRTVRTEMMLCGSDVEYIGKLICVRQGFDYILSKAEPVSWLIQVGKAVACGCLLNLGCATVDFENAFLALLGYLNSLHDSNSKAQFADELASKGVQALNFYDIFFDRILINALENLGDPPQSIYTLTRNTWLSPSFKRSALDSAVWTLMAAKRKMLKYPEGFFALYYRVVETVTAALAWGFLGTDESLNTFCDAVREEVVRFLRSLFKFADNYDYIVSNCLSTSLYNNEDEKGDDTDTASSAFLELEENEVNYEDDDDDDVTITPEGEKAPSETVEHQFYRGMNYDSLETFSVCVYTNVALLQRRLASLITDFAGNNSIQLPASVRDGLNLTQPPLPSQARVSDV